LTKILPDSYREVLLLYPEPVVIVEYKREHFVSHDGILRLTMDYDLVFYAQMAKRWPVVSFGLPMHDMVVLESKGPIGTEQALRMLLYPFAPRITRSSKYVHGCQLLGLMAGITSAFD
jgi:hypothetical protein